MSRATYITERCPVCSIEFKASPVLRHGSKAKEKRCPNGHWATVRTLKTLRPAAEKITPAMVVVPAPPPLYPKQKEGESFVVAAPPPERAPATWRDYRAMVVVLVNAYDVLIDTLPVRGRGVVDGVFGKPVALAKEMIGDGL